MLGDFSRQARVLDLRLLGGKFRNRNYAWVFNGHFPVMAGVVPAIHALLAGI
jgi:hypothetical protein